MLIVSTLVVEWIEIIAREASRASNTVSTLVVEWIEIDLQRLIYSSSSVSTLVVEWIEIICPERMAVCPKSLHPRGGVD